METLEPKKSTNHPYLTSKPISVLRNDLYNTFAPALEALEDLEKATIDHMRCYRLSPGLGDAHQDLIHRIGATRAFLLLAGVASNNDSAVWYAHDKDPIKVPLDVVATSSQNIMNLVRKTQDALGSTCVAAIGVGSEPMHEARLRLDDVDTRMVNAYMHLLCSSDMHSIKLT
jgi:hypothetical protein